MADERHIVSRAWVEIVRDVSALMCASKIPAVYLEPDERSEKEKEGTEEEKN